jgi:hypothetical protein
MLVAPAGRYATAWWIVQLSLRHQARCHEDAAMKMTSSAYQHCWPSSMSAAARAGPCTWLACVCEKLSDSYKTCTTRLLKFKVLDRLLMLFTTMQLCL